MARKFNTFSFVANPRKKHGRIAKKKTSFNKGAQNYTKKYRGQGK
jgi:hypothetical protein